MKYTIQDLKNGKVVINLQEGDSIELLNKIMTLAFKNTTHYSGSCEYYGKIKSLAKKRSSDFISTFETTNTCKLSDIILPEEEFIFPENWHVVVTKENQKILSDWRGCFLEIGWICGSTLGNKGHNYKGQIRYIHYDFGKEITFEQFKKYVLRENTLKVGDEVNLYGVFYKVIETSNGLYYMNTKEIYEDNDIIFRILGIEYQFEFQKSILGYELSGEFPYCKTLEDLTKFVEAIENYKMKEIIGYKWKEGQRELYDRAAALICEFGYGGMGEENVETGYLFAVESGSWDKIKEAGVLDLWFEPVYKEVSESKNFILSSMTGVFELTVSKEGIYYSPDKTWLNPEDLKGAIEVKKGNLNRSNQAGEFRRPNHYEMCIYPAIVDLGCRKGIPKDDIENVVNYYYGLQ